MDSGLYGFLKNYSKNGIYPFHMPGHKRNPQFLDIDAVSVDVTEINCTDNLHNPTGIIRELQERIAQLFGANRSFLLVNGSSCGLLAAIMSTCSDGDEIIIARNAHRSAFSGLVLSGASPIYVYPEALEYGFCGAVKPEDIEKRLSENPNVKAVLITSPTYEGICSNIKKISEIVHSHGKILIVDEAHGAHFGFHEYFPESAVRLGADIVVQSLHKTLPAFTQTALLHVNGKFVEAERIKLVLAMVETSSPSYVFMSAADRLIQNISLNKNVYFDKLVNMLYSFRDRVSFSKNLRLLEFQEDFDRSKIVLYMESGMSGTELEQALLNDYKIQVEMSGIKHVLALCSVADTVEGFSRLFEAIMDIDRRIKLKPKGVNAPIVPFAPVKLAVTPRNAFTNAEKSCINKISYKNAAGKISADFVILYPPGIPLLQPGENIDEKIINVINSYVENGISVIGVENGEISTFL